VQRRRPVDLCLVIKQRLQGLGLEQRDLAVAGNVTESYISQLLTRKKMPPASERTDIYDKMAKFLKVPARKAKVASPQNQGALRCDRGGFRRLGFEVRNNGFNGDIENTPNLKRFRIFSRQSSEGSILSGSTQVFAPRAGGAQLPSP